MSTNNTKQAFWVAVGNFFTFSFGIVSTMILSRYFDKTEYGTYKQVFYIYNILLGMFTLGLPNAYSYFLARSPFNEAKNLIWKMTRLFMVLGLCISFILIVGAGLISDIMKNPSLKRMLVIFSPVPFLLLPSLGLQNILVTFRKSSIIPFYVIITSVTQFVFVVVPVIILDLGCSGALIGFDIGALVTFGLTMYLNTYPVRKEANDETKDTYKEIFKFAFPLFIATIWGTLINSTDQFFISRYFGTDVFADFSNGATDLPFVGMIIGATSAVLTPVFTRAVKDKEDYTLTILPVWKSAFSKSAMLIYPITVFCIFNAQEIMTVLYGDNYIDSTNYFRIKLFTYFFKIIAFYPLIIAMGATKFYQSVHLYEFVGLALSEILVVKFLQNPLFITGVHVFFTIVACLVFIFYVSRKFDVSFLSMFPIPILIKTLVSSVAICLVIRLIELLFQDVIISTLLHLTIDFGAFIILYYLTSLLLKLKYFEIIKPILKK